MKILSSHGRILLEKKVIDYRIPEIRDKVTENELESYYASFIKQAPDISDYFEIRDGFETALKEVAVDKRPKLIALERNYPFLWFIRPSFSPFNYLDPKKKKLDDEYFFVGSCAISIPRKVSVESTSDQLNSQFKQDMARKFEKYPGYEGILEIPNDTAIGETKSTLFHEALHYLILRYQVNTQRKFTHGKNFSNSEKYAAENFIHENAVEILTDKLLSHDPDSQFELRYNRIGLEHPIPTFAKVFSAFGAGAAIAASFSYPWLIPTILVPGRIRDQVINRHKRSLRKTLLKKIEYPQFKI